MYKPDVNLPKSADEWIPTPEELEGNKMSYCYMTQDVFPLRPLPQVTDESHQ